MIPEVPLITYPLTYAGVVVDNKDPEGLHRVRFRIPGLLDKSDWAFPVTSGGGSAQRGGHIVPAEGADIVAWFIGGDIERPIYACGWWGKLKAGSEMPAAARDAGADAHKVQTLEIGAVRLTYDEREDKQLISVEHTVTGDSWVWDLKNQGMTINLTAALLIKVLGVVDIRAAQISLNDRLVLGDSKGI